MTLTITWTPILYIIYIMSKVRYYLVHTELLVTGTTIGITITPLLAIRAVLTTIAYWTAFYSLKKMVIILYCNTSQYEYLCFICVCIYVISYVPLQPELQIHFPVTWSHPSELACSHLHRYAQPIPYLPRSQGISQLLPLYPAVHVHFP